MNPSTDHHIPDLKEALGYLPPNIDRELVCTALKVVHGEEGKDLAIEWFQKTKNVQPADFDRFWKKLELTPYQLHTFDEYLTRNLYDLAKQSGWIPKANRKGKNVKRPPAKEAINKIEKELNAPSELEAKLVSLKERELPTEHKSFIPPSIVNMAGGCYYHPFMKKEDIPENKAAGPMTRKSATSWS